MFPRWKPGQATRRETGKRALDAKRVQPPMIRILMMALTRASMNI
jgi:hypothetical protein